MEDISIVILLRIWRQSVKKKISAEVLVIHADTAED